MWASVDLRNFSQCNEGRLANLTQPRDARRRACCTRVMLLHSGHITAWYSRRDSDILLCTQTSWAQVGSHRKQFSSLCTAHFAPVLRRFPLLQNVRCLEYSSPSWARSVLANDLAIKWAKAKSMCLCWFRSMCGTDEREQRSNGKMGRSNGRTQDVSFLQRTMRNRWRSNWIWVEYFPRIFVIEDSSRDPTRFRNKEHQIWRFLQRHWTFLGLGSLGSGRKRSGMEDLLPHPKEHGAPLPMKWYSDSKKQVTLSQKYQCFESWNLQEKKGKSTIHFNGGSMNTELLFQTVHSVNQLSIYGAVANWCHQFDRRRTGTSQYSCGQQDVDQVETERSTTLGITSDTSNWKQDARKRFEHRSIGR